MKYLVQHCENLTAYASRVTRGPLNRVTHEEVFQSEEEALEYYERYKRNFRFLGASGLYVSYPREVGADYIARTDEQLEAEYNCEVESSGEYEEPYYEDEY